MWKSKSADVPTNSTKHVDARTDTTSKTGSKLKPKLEVSSAKPSPPNRRANHYSLRAADGTRYVVRDQTSVPNRDWEFVSFRETKPRMVLISVPFRHSEGCGGDLLETARRSTRFESRFTSRYGSEMCNEVGCHRLCRLLSRAQGPNPERIMASLASSARCRRIVRGRPMYADKRSTNPTGPYNQKQNAYCSRRFASPKCSACGLGERLDYGN